MKVAVIFAEGFEELEAISAVDVLRRGGVNAMMIGLDSKVIKGANGISVMADDVLENLKPSEYEMVLLPGGMPGASNLASSKKLAEILQELKANGKKLAAICAAPMALQTAGVLGERFACYPGFEAMVRSDKSGYEPDSDVVVDGNVITGKGPGLSIKFALTVLSELRGADVAKEVAEAMLVKE